MLVAEILNTKAHRPYPMPKGAWRYYQEWNKVVFMHWQVGPDELRSLVPKELEIDTMDGKAWVSMVAFTMEHIRPAYLPAISAISNFHEINIRTYVKHAGKTGVYFLSIEAANKISCVIARVLSGRPYRHARLQRSESAYHSYNKNLRAKLQLSYRVGKAISTKTNLEIFLTERYALFHNRKRRLYAYDIHHVEWPLFECSLNALSLNYSCFTLWFSRMPDMVQYSSGVQVISYKRLPLSH